MPHAVTATSDGKTYTYDCNGNQVAERTAAGVERTLTWDADNRPISITLTGVGTTTFAYSGDGARVKKVGLRGTYHYAGTYEVHNGDPAKHIFVGSLRVATRVNSGENVGTYFPHGDHLGSLNVVTNSSGGEVQRLAYFPFGETYLPGSSGDPDLDWRQFTGQELDPETGLYFYNARYYNPVLGRFVSPDPIVPEPGNPQSLNRYSYVLNSPATLVDPTGHQFEDFEEFPTDPFSFIFDTPVFSPARSALDPVIASQIYLDAGILPPGIDLGIASDASGLANLSTPNGSPVLSISDVAGIVLPNSIGATADSPSRIAQAVGNNSTNRIDPLGLQEQCNSGCQTGARLPDFLSANVSITIPTPWTGTLLSWTFSASADRFGNLYWSPIGPGAGRAPYFVSGSLTANWLLQQSGPTPSQLSDFLSANGFTGALGFWGGGNVAYSPGNGFAGGLGFVSPQGGANYSYSFRWLGNTGISW